MSPSLDYLRALSEIDPKKIKKEPQEVDLLEEEEEITLEELSVPEEELDSLDELD